MYGVEAAITSELVTTYVMTGEDVVLSDFLTSVGAPTNIDIEISILEASIIGGVAADALTIDDVSGYSNITIFVEGDIQGFRGGNAIGADVPFTLIDEGTILTEIDTGAVVGGSKVTIHVKPTGRILAGGGNGGAGGKGGNGSDVSWAVPFTLIKSGDRHTHGWGTSPDMSTWWANVAWHVYSGSPGWVYWFISAPDGNDIWARGAWEGVPGSHWYEIRYGNHTNGNGGAGGGGGLGQGYQQALTNGAGGSGGTYRSGSGGAGGNGGTWGLSGNVGNSGGVGYFYNTSSSNNTRAGSAGSGGTAAGKAIKFN